jgi:asparagine synthase (glutamine-hydrolysing)
MCGIAGLIAPPSGLSKRRVVTMLRQLAHRGPDDEGLIEMPGATIGARRLAIIDLLGGRQPMANENGAIVAVQNGEIYNFREIRQELEATGHRFRTDNDTEVVPHAYEHWGLAFASRLRGMFAIALWDETEQRLVLVRDRLGKKPLFYAPSREFAFASEIQALLTLNLPTAVDHEAIREYLAFGYVSAPRSAFQAIRKVRPGHWLEWTEGAIREEPYWTLEFGPKADLEEADAIAELDRQLDDAVRARLISDVPLGVFLSGGLDSSTVVSYMAKHSSSPVRTYSVGFSDDDFSELRFARVVAERFSTDHHELVVDSSAIDALPTIVRHLGEPFADSSIVPTYYVAKAARAHVTVALNGDGGDELLAGYQRYRAALVASDLEVLPLALRRGVSAIARRAPEPRWLPGIRRFRRFALTLGMTAEGRYRRWTGFFTDPERLWGERLRDTPAQQVAQNIAANIGCPDGKLDRLLAIDLTKYLPGDLLVKMDIAAMANSLETRSPFLDHKLLEFVARLPERYKLRGSVSKYLLRRLMHNRLPREVLVRRKMGFGAPIGRWFRGPLRPLIEDLVLSAPDRGYVDRREVRRIVDAHMAAPAENGFLVWSLLMLEAWFRYVEEVDRVATRA